MLGRIQALLTEPLMGFLALMAMGAALGPELFTLPSAIEWGCDVAGWAIVAVFALEYGVNFAVAPHRGKFARDPWRILDAVIVLAALASLLPAVSDLVRSSPSLRMLRLFRVLIFGARAGSGLRRPIAPLPRPAPVGSPRVAVLRPGDTHPRTGEWSDLLKWAASSTSNELHSSPTSNWLHASNLAPERLQEVAVAAGVPHVLIEAALHESSYPRLESGARWSALTVSVPKWGEVIHRDPVLLLVSEDDVLSLAVHPLDLQAQPKGFDALAWGPRCTLHVVRHVLDCNEEMAGRLERATRELEELRADESPETFFEQTFRLKRALSTAKADLWRLRGLLQMFADGRRVLPGLGVRDRGGLRELVEEADFLYETANDIRESVLSLIELHINIAAHDTNRFLRLLAALSSLALIPAVVGGLLGMNLVDAPWTLTLGQVAFITLVLMLGVLYAFMAKGWLR